MNLVIGLMPLEEGRLLSLRIPEAEYLLPQARIYRSRMRDHAGIAFAPDVLEAELRECFQRADVAKFFSERCPFDLGEILEPADAAGADGLVAVTG